MPHNQTERVGINAVEAIILNEFNWIFREQPISDFGIDAQVEIVEHDKPTGKLIGLQIKTGASYFRKRGNDYVFYGELRHLEYWTRHSLPVFLILHDPEKDLTLWQKVDKSLAEVTDSRWSITIPASNILTATAKNFFAEGIPSDLPSVRRANMALDYEIMLMVRDNPTVYFEVEDWVNKSLNVRGIKVFIDDYEKDEPDWDIQVSAPTRSLDDLIYTYYPWLDYDHIETRETASAEVEVHILRVRLSDLGNSYLMVEDYYLNGRAWPEPDESEPDESEFGEEEDVPPWITDAITRDQS
jgi:hypothetical protein